MNYEKKWLEVLFIDISGNIGFAFVLTIIAGLSTGIGSAIAYFIKKPRMIYLSFSLGFSAGVMIYVSFVELLPQALENVVIRQTVFSSETDKLNNVESGYGKGSFVVIKAVKSKQFRS